MKLEKKLKTKHINFHVDEETRNQIDDIRKDYFLSDVLRASIKAFHKKNYGKKQKKGKAAKFEAMQP